MNTLISTFPKKFILQVHAIKLLLGVAAGGNRLPIFCF